MSAIAVHRLKSAATKNTSSQWNSTIYADMMNFRIPGINESILSVSSFFHPSILLFMQLNRFYFQKCLLTAEENPVGPFMKMKSSVIKGLQNWEFI